MSLSVFWMPERARLHWLFRPGHDPALGSGYGRGWLLDKHDRARIARRLDAILCATSTAVVDDVVDQALSVREREDIVRAALDQGAGIRELFDKYQVF